MKDYTGPNTLLEVFRIVRQALKDAFASCVTSFNGRTGAVTPAAGDYTVSQVTGAAPAQSPVFTGSISLGRKSGTKKGSWSVAEGHSCEARESSSHAEGESSIADGIASHAEGYCTFAGWVYGLHAEGTGCIADENKVYLPIESASGTTVVVADNGIIPYPADRVGRIKQGSEIYLWNSEAISTNYAVRTVASVDSSTRTITLTEALPVSGFSAKNAVVPSLNNLSSNSTYGSSHAEGKHCAAIGHSSHAEGINTIASGDYSHAGGSGTIASARSQTAIGMYNVQRTDSPGLIVGKGNSDAIRANCFRVTVTGVYASGNYNASGADYAELFEWADGNPDSEDRVGRFVTLDGAKIRLADPTDDYILGIVSGNPSVVGDVHDDQWQGMYLTDIFGRPICEDVEVPEETEEILVTGPDMDENGGVIEDSYATHLETVVVTPAHTERRQKLNPDYDTSQLPYIPRSQRPEWDAVGLLGKLVAVDDGTCEVNGWATVGEGGAATTSAERTRFRVMERLDGNHVRIMILI